MSMVEVADRKWEQFCHRLDEFCHGALVQIRLQKPDGSSETIAEGVPLVRVALDDESDPCNNNLVIEAGRPDERPVRHVVVEPIHIRLKNGGQGGRYNQVHILAENGTTILALHPGISPGLLNGLGG